MEKTKEKNISLTIRRAFIVSFLITNLFGPFGAIHTVFASSIEHFSEISEGVYRGAQPSEGDFAELKALGVRTVINFRHEHDWIEKERAWAEAAGLEYVSLPWTIWGAFEPAAMEQFFEILDQDAKQPVFFHCRRGVERTGVAAALYRMKKQGYSKEEAVKSELDAYPIRFIWKPFVNNKLEEYRVCLFDKDRSI